MTDIVSAKKRSAMMAGIRGKNTKPEIEVRRLLHAMGYRFRLHRKDLPGKPDIVLPKYRCAIFVNGCFWHGHGQCRLFRLPKSRQDFWRDKIANNVARDLRKNAELERFGWKVITVWECALRGKASLSVSDVSARISDALQGDCSPIEIRGDIGVSRPLLQTFDVVSDAKNLQRQ